MNVQLATDRQACRPLLERALRYEVGGLSAGVEQLVGDAAIFEIRDDAGHLVGAFALEVNEDSAGRSLEVLAAGGKPGHDLTGAMVDAVTREAREHVGAHCIGCTTKRRGLVKRLQAEGFEVAGFILRKKV